MATPAPLRTAALSLGAVSALDMLSQAALPMVLARWLSPGDFGEYRLLWLIAGTAVALLPMAMPGSLNYFVPRSQGRERAQWYLQSAAFLGGAAVVAALVVWASAPAAGLRAEDRLGVAAFTSAWVFASLLDVMFSARLEGPRQAKVNLVFVILRLALVLAAAGLTKSFFWVLIAHVALALVKAATCIVLLTRPGFGRGGTWCHAATWRAQLTYAAPLGLAGGLYMLRTRIDQWLVATLHMAAQFGLYSVAAVFNPVQGLTRTAINSAVLPELNRLHQGGEHERMLQVNNRANTAVALVMFPFVVFVAVAARPLLELLFGPAYGGAALAMQIYMAMLLVEAIEMSSLVIAFRQASFMLAVEALLLIAAALASAGGIGLIGLNGAALGALVAALVAAVLTYRRCAHLLARPVRELQPWTDLAKLLGVAFAAATAAAAMLNWWPSIDGSFMQRSAQLGAAALAMAATYLVLLRVVGAAPLVTRTVGPRFARWLGLHAQSGKASSATSGDR
jgi:O-antigen/teichoic acid export membrane protein